MSTVRSRSRGVAAPQGGAAFEPEAIRDMSVALESVCAELGLSDKDDPATRMVASKIIEFAQSGVLDAARKLRPHLGRDRLSCRNDARHAQEAFCSFRNARSSSPRI
jgi:hypothetical protein